MGCEFGIVGVVHLHGGNFSLTEAGFDSDALFIF